MGDEYCKVGNLLKAACERAGATEEQTKAVFQDNAVKAYKL
jgi:hypothetical protein|eukprot:COSAG06_NODE_11737_length_1471_cov_1.687318_3_plen_41_part_00